MSLVLALAANLLFNWGQLLDSAVAYAGSPVNGATRSIQNTPTRLHFKIVVSAGSFSSNNIVGTVQTSVDGTNWIATSVTATFTANAVAEVDVNVPVGTYVRIAYSGAASGTVNTYVMANVNLTQSSTLVPPDPQDASVNGLCVCRQQSVLYDTAAVATTINGSAYQVPANAHRGFLVVTVAGRTVGTLVAKLQFSIDGGTTWVNGDTTSTLSADGVTIIALAAAYGTLVRPVLTPGSSFDGTAKVAIWADGSPFLAN